MNDPYRAATQPRSRMLRGLGTIVAAWALVLGLAAPAAYAETDAVATFTFDEAPTGGGFTSGEVRATVRGDASLVAGRNGQGTAARLGAGFWLDLAKTDGSPVLQGLDAVTFSYDRKPEGGNQGWTIFASRSASPNVFERETYLGVIDTEAAITVERYDNAGFRNVGGNMTAAASRADWKHVDLVVDGATAKLYVDHVLVGENTTGQTLTGILGAAGGVLQVGKANWGAGEYFTGLIDNLTITPRALSADELRPASDVLAQQDADGIEIVNADDLRGNFSLPLTGAQGSTIAWEITSGGEFATLEDGLDDTTQRVVVTRPAAGDAAATVGLHAMVSNDGSTATKDVTVSITPKPADAGDPEAYVWAFFTGEGVGGEKISLAASKGNNALDWYTLNEGEPLFTSTLGEKGLRDPFIIRSHDGDKFYMLATDLKIAGRPGNGFMTSQVNGSLGIEVWESTNLVDWTAQRHAVVNTPLAGNTWAPEAYWDDELGTYVVYWASNLYDVENAAARPGDPNYNRMMYVTTDDFVSFSEPQVWIDVDRRGQAGSGSIDVSVQKVGDEYVRVYKDENTMSLRQEKSSDLLATVGGSGVKDYSSTVGAESGWSQMGTEIGNGSDNGYGGTFTGGEGPSLFTANPGDVNGYQYYLFADQPSYHDGPNHYVPMATDDIMDASQWEVIGDEMPKANFPSNSDGGMPRHGTILPVTKVEQEALLAAYAGDLEVESFEPLVAETMAGVTPDLPETVTLHMKSGETKEVGTIWNDVPAADYAEAGTSFVVKGAAKDASRFPIEVAVTVTEKAQAVDGLLADYAFTQTTGATVPNVGGNAGPARVQNQDDAQWTGHSLQLTGGVKGGPGNWVRLPNDLLTGADAATVTTEVKIDPSMKHLHNFLWNIGAENDQAHYFFVGLRDDDVFPPRADIRNGSAEAIAATPGNIDFGRWTSITTTIDGATDTLRLYFDGELVAEAATTLEPKDIADQTMNTIGKSPWPDPLFQGEIATFRVYDRAMDADEVRQISDQDGLLHEDELQAVAQAKVDGLTVPEGAVDADYVALPTAGGSVTWASSTPSVIDADGTVTQPDAGAEPVTVELTASYTFRGLTAERTTTVTVLPTSVTVEERAEAAAERYVIPPLLRSGSKLPAAPNGIIVTPVSATGGASLDDGALVLDGSTAADAEVTVTVARESAPETTVDKTFTVRVLPESKARDIAGYHRTPTSEFEANNADVALSMHLAVRSDPSSAADGWTPLNENYGVFFPKTSESVPMTGPNPNTFTRSLTDPAVFQLRGEEGYGVVSTRVRRGGADDGTQANQVLVAITTDLLDYTELGLLTLDEAGGVNVPTAVYDASSDAYVVSWTTDSGAGRHQVFSDLAAAVAGAGGGADGESASGRATGSHRTTDLEIADFAAGTVLTVPESVAHRLENRLGRITNTGYQEFEDLTVVKKTPITELGLPEQVTLDYSDGSTAKLPISDWDLSDLNLKKPGTYTVTGTVKQATYPKPFAVERADPSAFKYDWNGQTKYLMIATNDLNERHVDQYGNAFMPVRIGDTLTELADAAQPDPSDPQAEEIHLLKKGDLDAQGKAMTGCFWAPEFQVIGGRLSILFMPCYDQNGGPDYITGRASIMQLQQDEAGDDLDPADPANWSKPEWVLRADGTTNLNTDVPASNQISLDMTYFEDAAGQSYYAWQSNCSTYIATLDPAHPNRVTSDPVRIVSPEYAWDNSCAEGPNVLTHDGKLLMTYAGSQVGYTYATGLAVAPASGADLLDPASWKKLNYPLLKSGEFEGEWQLGTGHGMWSEDEDGNIVHVFHAKTDAGIGEYTVGRDMFVRRVHFDAEGIPVLDMESSEELASPTVTLQVIVKASPNACAAHLGKPGLGDVPRGLPFDPRNEWACMEQKQ